MPRFVTLPVLLSVRGDHGIRIDKVNVAVNVDHVRVVARDTTGEDPDTRCVLSFDTTEEGERFLCALPLDAALERLTGAPESLAGVDSHAFDGRTVCRLIGEAKGEQWNIVQEIRHADGMVETSEISDGHTPAPADAREVLAAEIARCILESDGLFPRTFRWESGARIVEDWS